VVKNIKELLQQRLSLKAPNKYDIVGTKINLPVWSGFVRWEERGGKRMRAHQNGEVYAVAVV
jgi:hypothetical protein